MGTSFLELTEEEGKYRFLELKLRMVGKILNIS